MLDRIDTAYKAQRQFVDDAGHELRTPITVIRGHLELLDTATHDQRERSVKLCMDELDRMTRMVNDLLTLAIADTDGPSFLHIKKNVNKALKPAIDNVLVFIGACKKVGLGYLSMRCGATMRLG